MPFPTRPSFLKAGCVWSSGTSAITGIGWEGGRGLKPRNLSYVLSSLADDPLCNFNHFHLASQGSKELTMCLLFSTPFSTPC